VVINVQSMNFVFFSAQTVCFNLWKKSETRKRNLASYVSNCGGVKLLIGDYLSFY